MTKIQEIHNYDALTTFKTKHLLYEQQTKLKNPYQFRNKNCLIGIEIEIENIIYSLEDVLEYYWSETEDHSLRNNGKEYKSIPLRAYQIPYCIEYLTNALNHFNKDYTFSNRCSVHVHLNVRDFTMEQLACFLLLYCVFEKHFFHVAGTKRENNIFCVPLWNTTYVPNLKRITESVSYKIWHKYLALNCGCIFGSEHNKAFGTIEFRHLYGTLDTTILYPWINSIIALREASTKYKLNDLVQEIITANTTSQYLFWYDSIFQDLKIPASLLTKKDHESGISNLKQNLFSYNNIDNINYFNTDENHWFSYNKTKRMPSPKKLQISLDNIVQELLNTQTTAPGIYDTITTTTITETNPGSTVDFDFDSVVPIDPIQGF